MNYSLLKYFAGTCALAIDNRYLLCPSYRAGGLYKIYLENDKVEFLTDMSSVYRSGRRLTTILKFNQQVFLIANDCYEIIEYHMESNQFEVPFLYKTAENLLIDNAFIYEDRIYLFPRKLSQAICVYSIRKRSAEFIYLESIVERNWTEQRYEHEIIWMHQEGEEVYAAISGTSCVMQIYLEEKISGKLWELDSKYKLASVVAVNKGYIYISQLNSSNILCLSKDGDVKEIEFMEEREEAILQTPFRQLLLSDNEIIAIPHDYHYIQYYNIKTNKLQNLLYPEFFKRIHDSGKPREPLFWGIAKHNDKVYLLPFAGNALLVLSLSDYSIRGISVSAEEKDIYYSFFKELGVVKEGLRQGQFSLDGFVSKAECKDKQKDKMSKDVGYIIYERLMKDSKQEMINADENDRSDIK